MRCRTSQSRLLTHPLRASKRPLTAAICLGAEVNDTLSLGISPLHLAAYGGNLEAVDSLVRAGAAVDYKGAG